MDRIGRAVLTGTIGVIALAAGLEGYFIRVARPWERAIFIAAALCLIDPGLLTDLIGLGLLHGRPRPAEAPAGGHDRPAGETFVSRAAQAVLTLIAATLLVGTVLYGVLRVYA